MLNLTDTTGRIHACALPLALVAGPEGLGPGAPGDPGEVAAVLAAGGATWLLAPGAAVIVDGRGVLAGVVVLRPGRHVLRLPGGRVTLEVPAQRVEIRARRAEETAACPVHHGALAEVVAECGRCGRVWCGTPACLGASCPSCRLDVGPEAVEEAARYES